jgi:hypothetical protein
MYFEKSSTVMVVVGLAYMSCSLLLLSNDYTLMLRISRTFRNHSLMLTLNDDRSKKVARGISTLTGPFGTKHSSFDSPEDSPGYEALFRDSCAGSPEKFDFWLTATTSIFEDAKMIKR